MKQLKSQNLRLIQVLKSGGVAIIPTDTIYGLVGQALNPVTVERIYKIKSRKSTKPLIVLISKMEQLELFNITLNHNQSSFLKKYWPGKVSVVLPCFNEKFEYLTRGTKSLAFRLPQNNFLIELISQTGPLVAPSANPEGLEPAINIKEAKKYFKNNVDYYFDNGEIVSSPSTLVDFTQSDYEILRGKLI